MTLRATSIPARSSRGSGSVNPASFASVTISEKAFPGAKLLKIYESVPLKMPSTCKIRSNLRKATQTKQNLVRKSRAFFCAKTWIE